MLDAELLALLVCPETHQDLTLATPAELAQLNEAILQRKMQTVAGKTIDQPLEGALIRTDRKVAYPIRDAIPIMLVAEGVALSNLNSGTKA